MNHHHMIEIKLLERFPDQVADRAHAAVTHGFAEPVKEFDFDLDRKRFGAGGRHGQKCTMAAGGTAGAAVDSAAGRKASAGNCKSSAAAVTANLVLSRVR